MNNNLKNSREKTGLTQVQVAGKAKISERQYIRIEKENIEPRVRTAIRIAQSLGSTVEALFPLPKVNN